ncbi:hypothetical protein ARZXY2_4085 [Arthrobacter sp. ZXY-2]|nr:hypothetical protein ARZXY2_4085 [Arthrobacter sp. ZXY-2]
MIYVDANRVGMSGLVELIKAKISGAAPAVSGSLLDGRVPRSPESIDALIAERPDGWEYLLYAGLLRAGVDALEPRYRDHAMEYAAPTGRHIARDDLTAFAQAAMGDALSIAGNFSAVLDPRAQEAAFGAPGEPGDVDRIRHMAERFVSVYGDFMSWAASLRGASVLGEHAREAIRLLASTSNHQVDELRRFVDEFVAECDTLSERLERGETVNIQMRVTLDLDDELMDQYLEELRRAVEDAD